MVTMFLFDKDGNKQKLLDYQEGAAEYMTIPAEITKKYNIYTYNYPPKCN